MSNKTHGLGKGLGALMGTGADSGLFRSQVGYINNNGGETRAASEAGIMRIPMDKVEANPFQPRMNFDREALEELADSIKTLGLIQPITVRRLPSGNYQIISGERRFRACRSAGLTTIPAYVRETDDKGMLEMAIVENIQRQDLDPIETALSYQRLMDECSLTQDQMAVRVGKKRATVANTLRMLRLPVKIQHDLKLGLISTGHAKALLGIENPEEQERLCEMVINQGLSVRELEALVRRTLSGEVTAAPSKQPAQLPLSDSWKSLVSGLGRFVQGEISARRSVTGKGGSITIRFKSDEDIDRALEELDALGRQ